MLHIVMLVSAILLTIRSFRRSMAEGFSLRTPGNNSFHSKYGKDSDFVSRFIDSIKDVFSVETELAGEYFMAAKRRAAEGASIDAELAAEMYREDRYLELEWLERLASLFLLTGVVGTLWGLFHTIDLGLSGGETRNIGETLGQAFQAFGVTIVAVLLSAVAHVLDMSARSRINNVSVDLRRGLVELKARNPFSSEVKAVLASLTTAIGELKDTLANPAAFTKSLTDVHTDLDAISGSLKTTSAAMAQLTKNIELIRQETEKGYKESTDHINSALKSLSEEFDKTANSLKDFLDAANARGEQVHRESLDRFGQTAERLVGISERIPALLAQFLTEYNSNLISTLDRHKSWEEAFFTEEHHIMETLGRTMMERSDEFVKRSNEASHTLDAVNARMQQLKTDVDAAGPGLTDVFSKFIKEMSASLEATKIANVAFAREVARLTQTISSTRQAMATGLEPTDAGHPGMRYTGKAWGTTATPEKNEGALGWLKRHWVTLALVMGLVAGVVGMAVIVKGSTPTVVEDSSGLVESDVIEPVIIHSPREKIDYDRASPAQYAVPKKARGTADTLEKPNLTVPGDKVLNTADDSTVGAEKVPAEKKMGRELLKNPDDDME